MFGLLAILAVAGGVLYYLKRRVERRRMYELAKTIPGPAVLPLAGKAFSILRNHNTLLKYIYQLSFLDEYQNVAKLWLGPRLLVALVNPKDIEIILSSSVHLKKSQEYKFFEPWFGNGLLISNGESWKHQRKIIAPTFHLNILKRFMDEFNRNSQRVIGRMQKENGKKFDCHDYMSEIMVETLIETVMGVRQESKNRDCFNYAHSVMDLCDILHTRHTRPWYRSDSIFKLTNMSKEWDRNLQIIFNLTNRVFKKKKEDCTQNKVKGITPTKEINEEVKIETKIEEQSEEKFSFGQAAELKDDLDVDDSEFGEKKRLPFLESLIDRAESDGLSDKDIIDQVNTIMFEGHDTTAAGSSFFLCVMGARPDIQEKCIEEIDSIFGDSDRPVTFQDTVEMKYLERCIMETLRLFPPVPVIARELEQEVKLASSEDIILPKDCAVLIGTFKLHRRSDIYPDPEKFDPDRFLPQNAVSRHYYSFIPFSAGPRSCVGRKYAMLKLKILLANILRTFRIKEGKPMEDWELQADIILKRTDKFEITLEPRKLQKVN